MSHRNTVVRIVLIALLCYSLIMYASSSAEKRGLERELSSAREGLEQLRAENDRLERRLSPERRDDEMRRLAGERLGLVLPGEKIFYFSDKEG